MSDAGVAVQESLIGEVKQFHRHDGAAAVRAMFGEGHRPDALFCLNDLLAHGSMRALADLGVRIPDDVAVVGFDDDEQSSFSVPTLTSIAPDKQQLAQLAVAALAKRLNAQDPLPAREIIAPFRLMVRGAPRCVTLRPPAVDRDQPFRPGQNPRAGCPCPDRRPFGTFGSTGCAAAARTLTGGGNHRTSRMPG